MQIPTLVLVVVGLAVLGGFLAYIGDLLGRKMGKKRLRLGKLRPKHTAVAFTVFTGAIIPVVTTAAIMIASKPVRDWVVEGPQVVQARNRLQDELRTIQRELTLIGTEKSAAEKTLGDQKLQLASLEQQREASESVQQTLSARVDELALRERGLQAKVTSAESRVRKADADLKVITEKLEDANELYQETQTNYQVELQRSVEQELRLIALEKQVAEAEVQANAARETLVGLEAEIDELESEQRTLQSRNFDLRQEIFERQQERARLVDDLRQMILSAQIYRASPVIVGKGDELTRMVVQGGLPVESAKEQLMNVVRRASRQAEEFGAKPASDGLAASIQERQRFVGENTIITITPEDQINAWADAITRSDGELFVIATAFYNFFEGDVAAGRVVPLDLGIFRNRLVYSQGQEIGKLSIAGGQPESEILISLTEFVRVSLSKLVLSDGIVPAIGGDVPIDLPGVRQLARVIEQVQRARGQVELTVITTKDTRASDRVAIDFKVRT